MGWTRSAAARLISISAGVLLLVRHGDDRDALFWLALALLLSGLAGILLQLRERRLCTRSRNHGAQYEEQHEDSTDIIVVDETLADLWDVPAVAEAFASGPPLWRQVGYFDERFDSWAISELAEFMWVVLDVSGWSIGLGDEVKPYVDLDLDPGVDPVLAVLRAHPSVLDAWHDDREVYSIRQDTPMERDEFAALAARALVAHHLRAVSRLA